MDAVFLTPVVLAAGGALSELKQPLAEAAAKVNPVDLNPVQVAPMGLPGLAILWGLALIAFGMFGLRAFQIFRAMRKAKPENRFDQIGERIGLVVKNVLLQVRIFNERAIGWPHFLIFWGFMLYATCFNWSLVSGLFPFLHLPYPDEIKVINFFLEVFAIVVLIALGIAVARRLLFPPKRLHLSLDANLILGLIALLMITMLLGSAFRIKADPQFVENIRQQQAAQRENFGAVMFPVGTHAPFGRLVADHLLPQMTFPQAADWSKAMWWLHMTGVFFFLCYLPYSKHMHLLASPLNVFFSPLKPLGSLDAVGVKEDYTAGAAKWDEFTWKQILCGFSCAECGRCDRSCPAHNSGYALSPQDLIQHVKQHFVQTALTNTAATTTATGSAPAGEGTTATAGAEGPTLAGGLIAPAEVWACTTCMACMDCCAVWNEQIPIIVQMRRHLVGQGAVDRGVQDMLDKLNRYGNSFGKSDRMRARWAQTSGLKIKDARKEEVEYLWFVGDYASFDPRLEEITKMTAKIFDKAGLNFGLLYEGERNAGNDVRRIGEEGLFEVLREKNMQAFGKAKFNTIVTTDPHTYNTLKNEYKFEGNGVKVMHYTEVIAELLDQGKLTVKKQLSAKVTYHDPCYLGRYNGIYDPPRQILKKLGVELVEMPRNRNKSYCCGAGGGRIWMEDTEKIEERPAENRIREAVTLPGVNTFVVACPKDIAMFRDAVKTTCKENMIIVKDIAELVWEATSTEA
jgi:Fe-S oxidoreductase